MSLQDIAKFFNIKNDFNKHILKKAFLDKVQSNINLNEHDKNVLIIDYYNKYKIGKYLLETKYSPSIFDFINSKANSSSYSYISQNMNGIKTVIERETNIKDTHQRAYTVDINGCKKPIDFNEDIK